jgi:Flp pilus assembly pilin Flp
MQKYTISRSQSGQALIEYLLIFSILGLISVIMVNSLSEFMSNSNGRLGATLTNHLSSGTCSNICYADESFNNR